MLLLLLVGCGDISNAWILEDAAFLDALPAEARHTVALDDEAAAKGEEDGPWLRQLSVGMAAGVNTAIFEVLWAVDEVRQLPPAERTEDGRRWGPFALREGVDVGVWVERTGGGRFDWGVDATIDGAELPYIAGTHYAGETVAEGDGAFTWTFDDVSERIGDPTRGSVEVDYDNRDGVDLLVALRGVTDGTAEPGDADYAYRRVDGAGDFQYATTRDLGDSPDGLEEDLRVRTRWIPGEGGRADAEIEGGTLGTRVERWSQCWSAARALVYEADDLGLVTPSGSEDACAFGDFAEVDRI